MSNVKPECPETSRTNPVKAIRLKCVDCCGGSISEVDKCPITRCALYPFRFGKNPFRTRKELSEEEKQVIRDRFAKTRANKKQLDTGDTDD